MNNNKLECVECGVSHDVAEVEVLVFQHTGMGPTCPKCIQQLNEDLEEQQMQDEILLHESKSNFMK